MHTYHKNEAVESFEHRQLCQHVLMENKSGPAGSRDTIQYNPVPSHSVLAREVSFKR